MRILEGTLGSSASQFSVLQAMPLFQDVTFIPRRGLLAVGLQSTTSTALPGVLSSLQGLSTRSLKTRSVSFTLNLKTKSVQALICEWPH